MVSDANAVRNLVTHEFAADLSDAGARAVNSGVDMEMAISEMETRLRFESRLSETEPLSLDAAMAFLRRPMPNA